MSFTEHKPGVFEIEDGRLVIAAELDYEVVTSYTLSIEAADGGTPSLSGSTVVVVNVSDVNDNSPQFSLAMGMEIKVAEVHSCVH